jgi:hypothetical protein
MTTITTLVALLVVARMAAAAKEIANMTEFQQHFNDVFLQDAEGDLIPLLRLKNLALNQSATVMGENNILNTACHLAMLVLSFCCTVQILLCKKALNDVIRRLLNYIGSEKRESNPV